MSKNNVEKEKKKNTKTRVKSQQSATSGSSLLNY